MSLTLTSSIVFFVRNPYLQAALAVLGVTLAVWLYRIPSRDGPSRRVRSRASPTVATVRRPWLPSLGSAHAPPSPGTRRPSFAVDVCEHGSKFFTYWRAMLPAYKQESVHSGAQAKLKGGDRWA